MRLTEAGALLAPLVAAVALSVRRGRRGGTTVQKRLPIVPLFVAGFLVMVLLRSTGLVPSTAMDAAQHAQELLLATALLGLGSAVDLPALTRTGGRAAALGLCAWVVVAGLSYAGVLLVTGSVS